MSLLNSTVLMSDALHFATEKALNPYYGTSEPDLNIVIAEHTRVKQLLQSIGVTVVTVPSPVNSQDGVYTANWALVRGKKAILSRLPNIRKAEEAHAKKILTELGFETIAVPNTLRFSGQGDALPFGEYLFCNYGFRSDESALQFAAEQLGYTRIQLQTVPELDAAGNPVINAVSGWPDSFFYDIDLALAVLRQPTTQRKGLLAYCPEAFTLESQKIIEKFPQADKIIISLDEALQGFAANLISTGSDVIMSNKAPTLQAAIEQHGLTVHTPTITELAKGGGYIRCTTLSVNEAP
jgi:N-dimethylarginine dimethylaminohydrolase